MTARRFDDYGRSTLKMTPSRSLLSRSIVSLFAITIMAAAFQSVQAVPPTPELLEELKQSGRLQEVVDRLNAAKARGVCAPLNDGKHDHDDHQMALQFDPQVPDTFRALVVLVDFSDNPATDGLIYAQPSDFEELLFDLDPNDNHYSMSEFYIDNSYGNFTLKGDVVGWLRMPQTYAYYVDNQNSFGDFPQNSQGLARDALLAADPLVNYADYDSDFNGSLDGVFIVHAGPGAEQTGADSHIWSHKWQLASTLNLDGVQASAYTMEPEEYMGQGLITMGVFAHEYGHFLGLPDLYDTDYSSSGVGVWSLMAGGTWNLQGRYPAAMDAWCKYDVGFVEPINITSNQMNVAIPSATHNPTVYRLWTDGVIANEYFLIENRRKQDLDRGLPASGLLIYHVKENINGNNDEPNYKVAVEQADGLFQLEAGANSGDGGDVWHAFNKAAFDDLSTPDSRTTVGAKTRTAVWDISAADSVMYANFDINYSRPRFELQSGIFSDADFGNNNGVVEVGETVTFRINLTNLWLTAGNVQATMWSDNPDINFTDPSGFIGTVAGEGGAGDNNGDPIVFEVPANFAPCIDSFFVEITSSNPNGSAVFGFELHVGQPNVLLVDGDDGDMSQQKIATALFDRRTPYDVYDRDASGPPSAALLNQYETVIWSTGSYRSNVISASDVTALENFLDNGGNLFFNSQSAIKELATESPSFLANYFRVASNGQLNTPVHYGLIGGAVHEADSVIYETGTNQDSSAIISPINGAVAEFNTFTGDTTAVSYTGDYRLVLWGFGFEAINGSRTSTGFNDEDTLLTHVFDFFYADTGSLNPTVAAIAVENEDLMFLTDHTPTFIWSVDDTTLATIQQYEVTVGKGNLCSNFATEWASGVINGSDTSVVYNGEPLVDGEFYVVRVRVNNGTTWSAWSESGFRMNTPPTVGYVGGPKKGEQVFTVRPTLSVGNGVDNDGTKPNYEFELYADEALTSLVTSGSVPQSFSATTGWQIDVDLTEDTYYYWQARANDGFETSDYTAVDSFVVNAANQAPNLFSLLLPADGGTVSELYPRLHWQAAGDNDPGDSIRYTLYISEDQNFITYDSVPNWPDTFRTLSFPVDSNTTFYWKVKALDRSNAVTWSSADFVFYGPSSGCCIGMRGDFDGDGTDGDPIDLAFLVDYLFAGGVAPACPEEADLSEDGISGEPLDLAYIVDALFNGGIAPPACP